MAAVPTTCLTLCCSQLNCGHCVRWYIFKQLETLKLRAGMRSLCETVGRLLSAAVQSMGTRSSPFYAQPAKVTVPHAYAHAPSCFVASCLSRIEVLVHVHAPQAGLWQLPVCVLLPAPSRHCWADGSTKSCTPDGGTGKAASPAAPAPSRHCWADGSTKSCTPDGGTGKAASPAARQS